MSVVLRVILILISFLSFILCIKRIKQSKLKVENSVMWMIGSILLIIMSVFSNVVEWLSTKLGFMAPVNFVFLVIIGFLLIEMFAYNIRISALNEKIKDLDHYIAIKEHKEIKKEN